MKSFSLKGKTALVTGASGLLGRQHCLALAEAGANVVALDINLARCKEITQSIPNGNHLALEADVTVKDMLLHTRDRILKKYGCINILVNNAAINDMFEDPAMAAEQSQFEYYPVAMFRKSLEVNVTGMFLASQIFGAPMAKQGSGSIINIASTYGMVGPDQSIYKNGIGQQSFYKSASYPTSKGAVLNFTRYLASYWGKKGVRVNALSPGGVQNGQEDWFVQNYSQKTALQRMAQPFDYKGAIIFLASEASLYMTGANLVIDGGWTAV